MAEISITINGRSYDIACDDGQEGRVTDLSGYVDKQMQKIAASGAAYNDSHLLVLTALVLADELFEAREEARARPAAAPAKTTEDTPQVNGGGIAEEEQEVLLKVIEHLSQRVDAIAAKVEAA